MFPPPVQHINLNDDLARPPAPLTLVFASVRERAPKAVGRQLRDGMQDAGRCGKGAFKLLIRRQPTPGVQHRLASAKKQAF